ncbi:MAG TPA: LLM class F420-dependent oxidoreductase, partial [Stellaceae bacterium]|nr:LLM class F420-dependent oxidoreductase [Stellaceae bacterium]
STKSSKGHSAEQTARMKPFRFGVNVGPSRSRAEWIEKARRIEALGYDVLTVPDHLTEFFAPIPAIVSAAEATTTLRLGTNVLNNDFRHPVLVAREAATADLLTEGRMILGLGAGYMRSEYDQAGLAYDVGGIRVERLAEAVTVIKSLMTGEPVSFAGRHYRITGHKSYPLPVQRPHPPILIGGNGSRLLTIAALEADIVGFSGITFRRGGTAPDLTGWKAAEVDMRTRLVQKAAGARWAQLELNLLIQRVVVVEDRKRAAEELAGHWQQLNPEEFLETPHLLIGTVEQMIEQLRAVRQRWGFSYFTIFEPYLSTLAPVVAELAGK